MIKKLQEIIDRDNIRTPEEFHRRAQGICLIEGDSLKIGDKKYGVEYHKDADGNYACFDCVGCKNCFSCFDCIRCHGSQDCERCVFCSDSFDCQDCADCFSASKKRNLKGYISFTDSPDLLGKLRSARQTILETSIRV